MKFKLESPGKKEQILPKNESYNGAQFSVLELNKNLFASIVAYPSGLVKNIKELSKTIESATQKAKDEIDEVSGKQTQESSFKNPTISTFKVRGFKTTVLEIDQGQYIIYVPVGRNHFSDIKYDYIELSYDDEPTQKQLQEECRDAVDLFFESERGRFR